MRKGEGMVVLSSTIDSSVNLSYHVGKKCHVVTLASNSREARL